MLHDETKNSTKTKTKVGVLHLTAPKMVALLGAGARGHNLLPLSNLGDTLLGRSRHHQGAQPLMFLLKEGVRQLLISVCTSGAPAAAPARLPGTSQHHPSRPQDARRSSESGPAETLLLWKTSHVQRKFILGYSTGATIQHDHAEQSIAAPGRSRPSRARSSVLSGAALEERSGAERAEPRAGLAPGQGPAASP